MNTIHYHQSNLLITIVALVSFTACSHTTPYTSDNESNKIGGKIPNDTIKQRVILIGDAGDSADCKPQSDRANCEPVLTLLTSWAQHIPDRTFITFLGDNVYPSGIPKKTGSTNDKDRTQAIKHLSDQTDVIKNSGARGVLIPGNHDWGGASGPSSSVLKEETNALFRLSEETPGLHKLEIKPVGCPGPEKIELNDGVQIIVMDSQWWLTEEKLKPCPSDVQADLQDLLEPLDNPNDTIVVTHHPLVTHGTHGAFYDWKAHLFPLTDFQKFLYVPLPIVGSLYPAFREGILKSEQDQIGSKNTTMRNQWQHAFSGHAPFIHAAGHDHNLQVLTGNKAGNQQPDANSPAYLLVSGAGSDSKISRVSHSTDTLFAHEHTGFMVIDFFDDNATLQPHSVLLRVVEPTDDVPAPKEVIFSKWLRGGFRERVTGGHSDRHTPVRMDSTISTGNHQG
jgi:hypothetical protein